MRSVGGGVFFETLTLDLKMATARENFDIISLVCAASERRDVIVNPRYLLCEVYDIGFPFTKKVGFGPFCSL